MRKRLPCYGNTSKKILELLTNFSNLINKITVLNDLLLSDSLFNRNPDFVQYICYFDIGRYYHFRCMGYMEGLVLTKCYSVKSLCYWKNKLVIPAYENISSGLMHLGKLESDPEISSNPTFEALIVETGELKKVAMEIMDTMDYYRLPC